MQSPITFSEVCEIEPRVGELIEDAKSGTDATWEDYSFYKGILSRLVGFGAEDTRLATCDAYEVCIDQLVEALNL